MLSFRLKKQTSKNVADTTFKVKLNGKMKMKCWNGKVTHGKEGFRF